MLAIIFIIIAVFVLLQDVKASFLRKDYSVNLDVLTELAEDAPFALPDSVGVIDSESSSDKTILVDVAEDGGVKSTTGVNRKLAAQQNCGCWPIDRPSTSCDGIEINTPEEYLNAVKAFESPPEHCISPNLYSTALSLRGNGKLEKDGYANSWVTSSTNLHRYLEINKRWGKSKKQRDLIKMLTALQTYIGYPIMVTLPVGIDVYNPGLVSAQLIVYMLPNGAIAQVPSLSTWFKIMETEYKIFIPLELGKLLIEAYSTLSGNEDVVQLFSKLTGCKSPEEMAKVYPFRVWPSTDNHPVGCDVEVNKALTAAGECQVGGNNASGTACQLTTEMCFTNFNNKYLKPQLAKVPLVPYESLVGPLRAILSYCVDANPFNTFVGLGYNTAANPFACTPWAEQSVNEGYTGREFIIPNYNLTMDLNLGKAPGNNENRPVLVNFPPLATEEFTCKEVGGTFQNTNLPPNYLPVCKFQAEDPSVYDFLTEGYGFWDRQE